MSAVLGNQQKVTEPDDLSISRPSEFIWLLSQCSRICDRVSISLDYSGLEISGNDQHGLLSLNARMPHVFTAKKLPKRYCKLLFGSRQLLGASRLLYGATNLRLRFLERRIDFLGAKGGEITYSVLGLNLESPERSKARYSRISRIPTDTILSLCKAGSIYSNEVEVKIYKKCMQLFEPETSETPIVSIRVQDLPSNGYADTVIPGPYLRRISELIRKSKADEVALSFERGMPLLLKLRFLDFARITIVLGQSKTSYSQEAREKTPPDFESCPIVELITFAGMRAAGIELTLIRTVGLDTSRSLNLLHAQTLGLIAVTEGMAHLTPNGKNFLRLLRNDYSKAKQFLHSLAVRKMPTYGFLAKRLSHSQASLEELVRDVEANSSQSEEVTNEYISSLIGILTWCGHATRKLALMYSSVTASGRTS